MDQDVRSALEDLRGEIAAVRGGRSLHPGAAGFMVGSMRIHEVLPGIFETTGLVRLHYGTNAARAASTDYYDGVGWWTSDTHDFYVGNGAAWQHIGGASGAPPGSHDLGGAAHNADTLANLNTKVSDATLDTHTASRPPSGAAGGELGGTYPNPTVDATHSGSAHHAVESGESGTHIHDARYMTDAEVAAGIATLIGIHAGDDDAHHALVTLHADLAANLLALTTQELDLDTQAANTLFAGPAAGGAAKPTFRAMVLADLVAHGSAQHTGTIGYSRHQYVFIPDAAPGEDVDVGVQQGAIHHSGPGGDTATRLYVDCETAPGTNVVITIQRAHTAGHANCDDLDTADHWHTVATITATGKSSKTDTIADATVPADTLLRMNVTSISGTDPKDMTVTLRTTRAVGA